MTSATVLEADQTIEEWIEVRSQYLRRKILLGSYMPLAGVRYYTILDEEDVASGMNKIGAVGWRLPNPSSERKQGEVSVSGQPGP